MFKKTAIALAVAGIAASPLMAQAESTVYGRVNVGIKSTSSDTNAANDGVIGLADGSGNRFGMKGSNDLGNGLTAGYRFEYALGDTHRGSTSSDVFKRIGELSLSGDFGQVKLGNFWGAEYNYLGYNTDRGNIVGAAAWGAVGGGYRVNDAIAYTYGGGGYSTDPFTFTVETQLRSGDEAKDTVDALTVAAAATFGSVTVNAASTSKTDNDGVESSLTGVGFRWNVNDALFLGGTMANQDPNDGGADDDENSMWNIVAEYSFGGGLKARLGIGSADLDMDEGDAQDGASGAEKSTMLLALYKSMGSGLTFYGEYEAVSKDFINKGNISGKPADESDSTLWIGFIQNF